MTTGAILGQTGDVAGVVTAVGTNQFTITTLGGISITAATTSDTQFFFPFATCAANDFTCIQTGDLIAADLSLLGDGSFEAATVAFEDSSESTGISGTVVGVNALANPPTFDIVVHGSIPAAAGVIVGDQAVVTVQATAKFLVEPELSGARFRIYFREYQ